MGEGILLSEAGGVDFMIHGVFSYELFGQTVWITTTHVCVLIVFLIIIGFCIAANRAVKHATCGGADCGNAGRDGRRRYGQAGGQVPELYWDNIHFYSVQQYFRPAGPASANSGLRRYLRTGNYNLYTDSF